MHGVLRRRYIYTSYSVSGEPVSEKVWVNIVTLGKERADGMAEWLKDRAGMEIKEIQVSPLPFEN